MHPIAASVGGIIGSFLPILILSFLLEWALFKRIVDDPVVGKVGSLAAACLISCALYLMSGSENYISLLFYVIAAFILLPYKIWRGMRIRAQSAEPDESIGEIFE